MYAVARWNPKDVGKILMPHLARSTLKDVEKTLVFDTVRCSRTDSFLVGSLSYEMAQTKVPGRQLSSEAPVETLYSTAVWWPVQTCCGRVLSALVVGRLGHSSTYQAPLDKPEQRSGLVGRFAGADLAPAQKAGPA